MQSGLCRKILFPCTRLEVLCLAKCGAGARLTAVWEASPATEAACPIVLLPEQESLMPQRTKARSLSTYLRRSTNPGTAGAGSGWCVTLDKLTSFSEPPLPVWKQRTGSRCSYLLLQLELIFACPAQMPVIPGTSQQGHRTGKGTGPLGHGQQLASAPGLCSSVCDPVSWEHLTFAKHIIVLQAEVVWMPRLEWGTSHPTPPLRPLASGCGPLSVASQERGQLCRGPQGLRCGRTG